LRITAHRRRLTKYTSGLKVLAGISLSAFVADSGCKMPQTNRPKDEIAVVGAAHWVRSSADKWKSRRHKNKDDKKAELSQR